MHTDADQQLSDPKVLAALYKAHLPATQAGLAALAEMQQKSGVHLDAPASVAAPVQHPHEESAAQVPLSSHPAFFTRGDFEYRLVSGTVSTYEYNRIRPKQQGQPVGASFAEGGVADGFILLGENGGFARQPVSYAVLDEHIRRDMRLIGRTFDIPVSSRDYKYYEAAEAALATVDRIWISTDEKTLEVVSGGRRWRIALQPGYRVYDRADNMLFPFADVSAPGRLYRGVEITVDSTRREVVLFDRESGIGRIATIPYEDLSDVTASRGPTFERSDNTEPPPGVSSEEVAKVPPVGHREEEPVLGQLAPLIKSEAAFQGAPDHGKVALKTDSTVPHEQYVTSIAPPSVSSAADIAAAVAAKNEAAQSVQSGALPQESGAAVSAQSPSESGRPVAMQRIDATSKLRVVSEIARDDGTIERIFELPYGKATFVARYNANNEILTIDVRSTAFIYPAAEMVDNWENVLLRKRRTVSQFTTSDEEEDLLEAKRVIVQRARERMIYRTVLESLDDESAEYRAVANRMKEIGREVTERYGDIFTAHN